MIYCVEAQLYGGESVQSECLGGLLQAVAELVSCSDLGCKIFAYGYDRGASGKVGCKCGGKG